jgi:hypothetical protein
LYCTTKTKAGCPLSDIMFVIKKNGKKRKEKVKKRKEIKE